MAEEDLNSRPPDDEETDEVTAEDLARAQAQADAAPEVEAAEPERLDVEELERKAAERDELHDKWLRACADYANLQQRTRKELTAAVTRGVVRLAEDILPVLDDFERALKAAESARDFDQLIQGVRIAEQALQQALGKHGIEPIAAKGEAFDPSLHQAVVAQPDPELAEGTVIDEIRRGYRMGDRVIRATQVSVATKPKELARPTPEEQEGQPEPED
jgi:molecular chaperone GrpE